MYRFTLTTTLLLVSLGAMHAQPPAAAADNGPSLAFTMNYIQDGLNTIDSRWRQSAVDGDRDQLGDAAFRITGAKADVRECSLSFRAATVIFAPGNPSATDQYYVLFRNISKLTVESFEARDERLGNNRRFAPSGFVLLIKMLPGKPAVRVRANPTPAAPAPRIRFEEVAQYAPRPATPAPKASPQSPAAGEVTEVPLYILDDELTQRLAKAIVHAVELCGGGDKDPFK